MTSRGFYILDVVPVKIRITSRCVCTFLCRQNIKISKKNVLDKSWTLTFHRQPSASSGELRYVHQRAGRETGSHRETNYFRLFFCASRLFLAVVFFLCVRWNLPPVDPNAAFNMWHNHLCGFKPVRWHVRVTCISSYIHWLKHQNQSEQEHTSTCSSNGSPPTKL